LAFDAFIESYTPEYEKAADCNQLPKLALGVTCNDGIEVIAKQADRQPKTAAA
jgi:putative transposase